MGQIFLVIRKSGIGNCNMKRKVNALCEPMGDFTLLWILIFTDSFTIPK